MAPQNSPVLDTSGDVFGLAADQYERYVVLADLGKSVTPQTPEYWAPAPAPLTISSR